MDAGRAAAGRPDRRRRSAAGLALHGYVMAELAGLHTRRRGPRAAGPLADAHPPPRGPPRHPRRSVVAMFPVGGVGVMLRRRRARRGGLRAVRAGAAGRGSAGRGRCCAGCCSGRSLVIGRDHPDPRATARPGIVPAEGRLTECSWDIGGPAPEGFWIFSGGQRLLNAVVFVPAGVLLVLVAARWRSAWVTVPARTGRCWRRTRSRSSAPSWRWRASTAPATSPTSSTTSPAPSIGVVIGIGAAAAGPAVADAEPLVLGGPVTGPAASPQRRRDPGLRAGQAAHGPAARHDVVQALLEREPLPAAARRRRGRAPRGRDDEPLPRHGQHRAVRRPRGPARRAGRRTWRRPPGRWR